MWAVGWGSQWHHTAAGHYCPEQMWSGWPRSSPMVSDTDPTQPAGTKSLSGARAHYRPSVGQEALWRGRQLLISQLFWKCDSHRTKSCPADLNQREEKADKGFILHHRLLRKQVSAVSSPSKQKCSEGGTEVISLSVLLCNPATWTNISCQFRSLTIIANSH